MSLEITFRKEWSTAVDYDAFKRKVAENTTANNAWKLWEDLGSSKIIICGALHEIQKTEKSSREVINN